MTFAAMSMLIGVVIGPLMFSTGRTLATRSMRSDYPMNVHAPVGANPSLGLFPLHSDDVVIGAVAAAGATAVLVVLFIALYPASQKLANRLAMYAIGTAIIGSGAIAPLTDLGLLRALSRWKGTSELASISILAAADLALLIAIIWFERRTVSTLGNVFTVDRPGQRLLLWIARVPLPWATFGALCWVSDWWGGVIASGGVIAATLVDDLVRYPSLRYETLDRLKMHEGLAAVCIAGIVLCGASLWTFGSPAARIPLRAIVVEDGSARFARVDDLTIEIQEKTMPRIEMKWSDPN